MWIVLAILTATNVIPPGREERTDYKMYAVAKASWFRVPYPGKTIKNPNDKRTAFQIKIEIKCD